MTTCVETISTFIEAEKLSKRIEKHVSVIWPSEENDEIDIKLKEIENRLTEITADCFKH